MESSGFKILSISLLKVVFNINYQALLGDICMNYFYRRIPPSSSSPQLPRAPVDSDLPQVGVELAGDTGLGQGEQGGLDTISVTGPL